MDRNFETSPQLSPGDQKVEEYAQRIKDGEDINKTMEGLPESFRNALEKRLNQEKPAESPNENSDDVMLPPQYEGMSAEAVEYIWTIPEYTDPEKTKQEELRKEKVMAQLWKKEESKVKKEESKAQDFNEQNSIREELGIPIPETPQPETQIETSQTTELSPEDKKKLVGWPASYELAKIAIANGVDLSKMSREDYMQYAIDNSLKIDDDQLRKAPWNRMGTSVEEVLKMAKEAKASADKELDAEFNKFSYEVRQQASTENRQIAPGIRVRQGTKDANSWLFFGVNEGVKDNSQETYKSYFAVKDLHDLAPDNFKAFMQELQKSGYNGDIKIFQDLIDQGVTLNDQVVMHGASEADAQKALEVARTFFGDKLSDVSIGKDEVIDGKNRSYSQILASKIKEAVDNK